MRNFISFSLKNKLSYKVFYSIFFISGFCGLAYELIWIKMFIPIFGIGLYSVSAVVSSFMGGLALGSYICGKFIDYKKNPLRYYAIFEFFIGLYAIVLPRLISINHITIVFLYNKISSNFYIFSILRFIVAFVLLIIPCSFIGATLPAMSRFLIIASKGNVGRRFGFLYGLNILGAVSGCLFFAFFMIERFGITVSVYITAIISIAIAAFSYLYSLISYQFDYYTGLSGNWLSAHVKEKSLKTSFPFKTILIVAFLCGFFALSYEMLWVRGLINLVSCDCYLFPIVLIIFLTGNSLGSFSASIWIKKIKNYSFVLAVSMIIGGLTVAFSFYYLSFLGGVHVYSRWYQYLGIVCLIIAASFLMGTAFISLVALYSSGIKSIGHDVGNVYSINTIGAVAGSFFTVFVFIPLFGLRNTLFYSVAVYMLIGSLIIIAVYKKRKKRLLLLCSICGIILITVFVNEKLIPSNLFQKIFIRNVVETGELVFYKEGTICSVGVVKLSQYGYSLRYSDRTRIAAEISPTGPLNKNHRLKAHIPVILHKNPSMILNIGFGTGITAHSLTLHKNIDKIDNVEICAETLEAAKYFSYNLDNVFNNPKTNIIVDDGRSFLSVNDEKYDIILIYPFLPVRGDGTIYLYTKDFLQLCRSKLKEGGFVAVWFPVKAMGREVSTVLLKTFLEVFPHSTVWITNLIPLTLSFNDIAFGGILLGTVDEEGFKISLDYLEKRLSLLPPEVKLELQQANIYDAKDLLSYYFISEEDLKKLCSKTKKIVTDDHTFLDYQVARAYWSKLLAMGYGKNKKIYRVRKRVPTTLSTKERKKNRQHEVQKYQSIWREKSLMKEEAAVDVSGTWESNMPNGKKGRMVFEQKGHKVTGVFTHEGMDKETKFSGEITGKDLVGVIETPLGQEIDKVIIQVNGNEMDIVRFRLDPVTTVKWKGLKIKQKF